MPEYRCQLQFWFRMVLSDGRLCYPYDILVIKIFTDLLQNQKSKKESPQKEYMEYHNGISVFNSKFCSNFEMATPPSPAYFITASHNYSHVMLCYSGRTQTLRS